MREQRKDAAKEYVTYKPRAVDTKWIRRQLRVPVGLHSLLTELVFLLVENLPVSTSELLLFKINISWLSVEAGICPTKHPVLNAAINYSLSRLVHLIMQCV